MYIFDFILQLSFSITLGFIIGLERQLTGHLAGIRTNIFNLFLAVAYSYNYLQSSI